MNLRIKWIGQTNKNMKRNIAKNTLSFMTSKSYKFIRTPKDT